jgi:cytochrome c2
VRKNVAHHLLIPGRFAAFTLGESAAVRQGERLLDTLACRRCHTVGGRGNRFATYLDSSVGRSEIGDLVRTIRVPALGMPNFALREGEVADLVNALLKAAKETRGTEAERPLAVHFAGSARKPADVFSRRCGACHRALTGSRGLLGEGSIGPNLSGLFSPFYPADFAGELNWTPKRLRRWLDNPRQVKENAVMQPVRLDDGEWRELLELLSP